MAKKACPGNCMHLWILTVVIFFNNLYCMYNVLVVVVVVQINFNSIE